MNFFSIDCSTDNFFLFIKAENKTFSKILQSDKSKNDLIMKQILEFFKKNNLKFTDLHKIFVNQGPGNFSGLRGSLAICKGICLSKSLNLYGYDTFVLSCANFLNKKDSIFSILKIRDKYFVKKFNNNFNNITKVEEISKEEIIKKYNNKFKVIPKNMTKYFDEKILKLDNINLVDLDYNQLEFLQLKGLLNKNLIKPLYLS